MLGRLNLFGEVEKSEADKIVEIAERAATQRGYATYDDYNEYMEPRIEKTQPAKKGWVQKRIIMDIKETLLAYGWMIRRPHNRGQTMFYSPEFAGQKLFDLSSSLRCQYKIKGHGMDIVETTTDSLRRKLL